MRTLVDKPHKIIFLICSFLIFTAFILTIVATCGSTTDYSLMNDIYINELDISHINVKKLVPEIVPTVSMLAATIRAPNTSYDETISALKSISDSDAISPLMSVLGYSADIEATLMALDKMMSLTDNKTSYDTTELTVLYQLLQNSKNSTKVLNSISSLFSVTNEQSNVENMKKQQAILNMLAYSVNTTESAKLLYSLASVPSEDKTILEPVLGLLKNSGNITTTFSVLSALLGRQINHTIIEGISATFKESNDIESSLRLLEQAVSDDEKQMIAEVSTLVSNSVDSTETLSTLKAIFEGNLTSSSKVQESFGYLGQLFNNSRNATLTFSTISDLADSTSNGTTEELAILIDLLDASKNETFTLSNLLELQSSIQYGGKTKILQVESLLNFLSSSKKPVDSFQGLLEISDIAQNNTSVFSPILFLLHQATNSKVSISDSNIQQQMPEILSYMNIAERFRLGIFSYCRVESGGQVTSCSTPHTVQDLNMKSILFNELENSDLRPYLDALNISEANINLEGKLIEREPDYEPAIRTVLAMNILTIIFAATLLIALISSFFGISVGKYSKWTPPILAILVTLFSLIGSSVAAGITSVIKDGTAADGYNVIDREGSAYYGLVWTSSALSSITVFLLFFNVFRQKRGDTKLSDIDEETSSTVPLEKYR